MTNKINGCEFTGNYGGPPKGIENPSTPCRSSDGTSISEISHQYNDSEDQINWNNNFNLIQEKFKTDELNNLNELSEKNYNNACSMDNFGKPCFDQKKYGPDLSITEALDQCIINEDDSSKEEIEKNDVFTLQTLTEIVQEAIYKGFEAFSPSARIMYEEKVNKFVEYYKNNFNNPFSKNFKTITHIQTVKSLEDFFIKRDLAIELNKRVLKDNDNGIFILYRIVNKKKQFSRIGFTSNNFIERLRVYLSKSFGYSKDVTNFHLDVRALGDRNKFNEEFEFHILFIENSIKIIRALERLITIYENRCDNYIGFDLSINNYYNKVVGNLYDYIDGEFRDTRLPMWRNIPLDELETAIKECVHRNCLLKKFPNVNSINTIRDRAVSNGFTLKGSGRIYDMKASLIKPILEEGVLKNLDHYQIVEYLITNGFTYLKHLGNSYDARKQWVNRMCDFIWRDQMHKIGYKGKRASLTKVKYLIVANEALKLAKNPKYNTGKKAQAELIKRGVNLKPPNPNTKYLGDLLYIFTKINWSYMKKQNEILKPKLTDLLRENPILSAIDIAKKFGLEGLKGKKLIENMLYRIFGKKVLNRESIVEIRNFVRTNII